MTIPGEIAGSVGSRIRLLLGNDGYEWLLFLDEDDGETEWQSRYSSSDDSSTWVHYDVEKQLTNCDNKGRDVQHIDFGPTGAWYIQGIKPDGSGSHSWWDTENADNDIDWCTTQHPPLQASFGSDEDGNENHVLLLGKGLNGCFHENIHPDLESRIGELLRDNKPISYIRLFDGGGYFISDNEFDNWGGWIDEDCEYELENNSRSSGVEEIAMAGDGCWVIIYPDHFVCSSGIDRKLKRHLARFFREQKERNERSREIREYNERREYNHNESIDIEREARHIEAAAERAVRESVQWIQVEAERIERAMAERAAREIAERTAATTRALEEVERQGSVPVPDAPVLEEGERTVEDYNEQTVPSQAMVTTERADDDEISERGDEEMGERMPRAVTPDGPATREVVRRQESEVVVSDRTSALETLLEERIVSEIKDVKDQGARLQDRIRSLKLTIAQMPPDRRVQLQKYLGDAKSAVEGRETPPVPASKPQCIVCHDREAVRAVIPCGHLCLCDGGCAEALAASTSEDASESLCPICRGNMEGTLKIYTA